MRRVSDVGGGGRRAATLVIAALATVALGGCGDDASGPGRAPTGTSTIPTTSTTTTVAVSGSAPSSTPRTSPPDTTPAAGEVEPFQAEPATTSCRLQGTSLDLGAVPADPVAYPVPYSPPPDAIASPLLPEPVYALNALDRWFRVGDVAIVRLDPMSAAPDAALTSGPCRIARVDADDDIAAALVCESISYESAEDRTGCSISAAAVADGQTLGSWAVDHPNAVTGVSVTDHRVVMATAAARDADSDGTAPSQVTVFDPSTGTGTAMRPTSCGGGASVEGTVPRTALALVSCQGHEVVDSRTGSAVGRFAADSEALRLIPIASDGSIVLLPDDTRHRVDTFEEVAEPPTPTSDRGLWFGRQRLVTGAGVWQVEGSSQPQEGVRVPGPPGDPAPGSLQPAELAMYDLDGAAVARWPTQLVYYQSRGGNWSRSNLAAADAGGAWLTTPNQVFRVLAPSGP